MDDLAPGTILGQYRIDSLIGLGGMASVYRGQHLALDRNVAIKVLPARYLSDAAFVERFRQEARLVARLRHPNILDVYDFGEVPGGLLYIVTELMEGGTLAAHLGTPMRVEEVVRIAREIGAGLDHAHGRGILHRDLKPGNVLFTEDGEAVIADFGLAKILEGNGGLTQVGTVLGTPEYMSPEQALGRPLDRRTDVYSMGVLAYTMLTGAVPFHGDSPLATMVAHVHEPLPPPRKRNPTISEDVERVLLKAMAKAPEERYDSAGELAAALAEAVSAGPAPLPDSGAFVAAETRRRASFTPPTRPAGPERDQSDVETPPPLTTAAQPVSPPPQPVSPLPQQVSDPAQPTIASVGLASASVQPASAPAPSASTPFTPPSGGVGSQAGAGPPVRAKRKRLFAAAAASGAVVLVAAVLVLMTRLGASTPATGEPALPPVIAPPVQVATAAPPTAAPPILAATPALPSGAVDANGPTSPTEAPISGAGPSIAVEPTPPIAEAAEAEPAEAQAAEAPAPAVDAAPAPPPAAPPAAAPSRPQPAAQQAPPQPAPQRAPAPAPPAAAPPPAEPPPAEPPPPAVRQPVIAPMGADSGPAAPAGAPAAPAVPRGAQPGGATILPMGAP
jgi:serine/threonine-protein kinase